MISHGRHWVHIADTTDNHRTWVFHDRIDKIHSNIAKKIADDLQKDSTKFLSCFNDSVKEYKENYSKHCLFFTTGKKRAELLEAKINKETQTRNSLALLRKQILVGNEDQYSFKTIFKKNLIRNFSSQQEMKDLDKQWMLIYTSLSHPFITIIPDQSPIKTFLLSIFNKVEAMIIAKQSPDQVKDFELDELRMIKPK